MGLFGPDKLIIELDKTNYVPGDKITGLIRFNLKKPLKGKVLEIALIGAQIIKQQRHDYHDFDSFDDSSTYETARPFFLSKVTLDGEKEYLDEEYKFEIKIPPDVHKDEPKYERSLGKLMKFAQSRGGHPPRIEWYVKAQLEVPFKIDLRAAKIIELS